MFAKTGKQRSGFYFADGGGDLCVRIGVGFFLRGGEALFSAFPARISIFEAQDIKELSPLVI